VVTTPVHTDPIVVEVDALQQQTGEGPCLDAIAQRAVFSSDDLETELRWIHFAPQATRLGIRSVLALPLTANSQLGALNLYARYPGVFAVFDRARAALLASLAGLALSVAHSHEDEERRADNLHARPDQSRDHRRSDGDSHGARADHRRPGVRRTASSLAAPQHQAARSGPEPG
jgi:GAF domain-containing protein